MSEALAKLVKAKRKNDRPQGDNLTPGEAHALNKLRSEAKDRGATLASGGKGGLPPSLVLGVMRRDKYRCKACDSPKDLTVHHKGGIVESKWLSHKGHSNDPNNIVTLCAGCHDEMHQQAKAEGVDSSQVTPAGDKNRKDK